MEATLKADQSMAGGEAVTEVGAVLEAVSESLEGELSKDIQKPLGELVKLLMHPDITEAPNVVSGLKIAADALLKPEAEVDMATAVIHSARRALGVGSFHPAAAVVTGLGALLYLALPVGYLLYKDVVATQTWLGLPTEQVLLVGLAGALGSIVSIMTRIEQFAKTANVDRTVLLLTGLFKPIVGTSFALFVYSTIQGGIIPVTIDSDKTEFFLAAMGFVAGFSERLAADVVTKAEKVVNGA